MLLFVGLLLMRCMMRWLVWAMRMCLSRLTVSPIFLSLWICDHAECLTPRRCGHNFGKQTYVVALNMMGYISWSAYVVRCRWGVLCMMRWYQQTNRYSVGWSTLSRYTCDLYGGANNFPCNDLDISSDVLQGKAKEKSIICVPGSRFHLSTFVLLFRKW
jgi:hypothetical protein